MIRLVLILLCTIVLGAPNPSLAQKPASPPAPAPAISADQARAALDVLGSESLGLAVYSRSVPSGVATGVRHRRMQARPEHAAYELFSVLRELDREGVRLIWVEEPPQGPEWDGVRDRLERAAA